MDESQLYKLLKGLELPVAYDHFIGDEQTPPFILYRNIDSQTFKADDMTYLRANAYIIDLVTEIKDVELEKQLEDLFDDNHLPYDKEEDYIESERIYQIRYFI